MLVLCRTLECVVIGSDLIAYVGCIAGAIPIEEYRQGLIEAGFAEVAVVDSEADLNAYAKVESGSGCCSPAASSLPIADTGSCCSPSSSSGTDLHRQLADLLHRYDVNEYAASVRVYAVKPRG